MQGQRSTIDPIPENGDISLGSIPNNDTMSEHAYLNNRSNPDGNCLPNYMDSTDGAASTTSSSLPSSECDEMKMEVGWSPSRSFCTGANSSSAGRELEPHNAFFPRIPVSVGSGGSIGQEYRPSVLDRQPSFVASLRNSGISSGSSLHIEERSDGSSSSLSSWGISCKRKAFEGTSGPSQPSTSSSCAPEDVNISRSGEPSSSNNNTSNPPDMMNLSSLPSSWNTPSFAIGTSTREVSNEYFPLSISRGGNSGQQLEPNPYNLSPAGTGLVRRFNAFPLNHLQRPGPSGDSLDLRSSWEVDNTSPSQTQLSSVNAPRLSINMHAFPWNGASHSRNSNFLNNPVISGSIDLGSQDEPNLRVIPRYSPESLAADSRNMTRDSRNWNIAADNTSRASDHPSSSRAGPSSSYWSANPSWASHRRVAPNRQRSVETAPWSLFSSVEPESGGQSSHFPLPGSSTSEEHAVGSSSTLPSHRQQFHRSAVYTEDISDDISGMAESLRALSANYEGRHRILAEIRQALSAVRRGENVRAEDYTFFEPSMFQSLAEMHDRHRDMRLDVDNMSYEDLLALGERIGDVHTGLKEETIMKHMEQKKKKEVSNRTTTQQDPEPCCVCQEEYDEEEDVGLLDCGHVFHVECIKQWLMHKNVCPICKTTGLSSSKLN